MSRPVSRFEPLSVFFFLDEIFRQAKILDEFFKILDACSSLKKCRWNFKKLDGNLINQTTLVSINSTKIKGKLKKAVISQKDDLKLELEKIEKYLNWLKGEVVFTDERSKLH